MSIKYLIDENLPPLYQQQLRRFLPELDVLAIGDIGPLNVPPKGTLDPEILIWCEINNFILVTNNRASMPVHLAEHQAQNRHLPGIFVFRKKAAIGQILDDLIPIAEVNESEEYRDCITRIPL